MAFIAGPANSPDDMEVDQEFSEDSKDLRPGGKVELELLGKPKGNRAELVVDHKMCQGREACVYKYVS